MTFVLLDGSNPPPAMALVFDDPQPPSLVLFVKSAKLPLNASVIPKRKPVQIRQEKVESLTSNILNKR